MTEQAEIRDGRMDDMAAVRSLLVETWHDTYDDLIGPGKVRQITDKWHSEDILARQVEMTDACFLVAEAPDAGIVGHAFAYPDGEGVFLSRLYVRPTAQGCGLGAQLLGDLTRRFPDVQQIHLEVEVNNVRAKTFYERHGFSVTGRVEHCGDEVGVPAFVMEKSFQSAG